MKGRCEVCGAKTPRRKDTICHDCFWPMTSSKAMLAHKLNASGIKVKVIVERVHIDELLSSNDKLTHSPS
jgi:predicted amidophosphoribosyltransferase